MRDNLNGLSDYSVSYGCQFHSCGIKTDCGVDSSKYDDQGDIDEIVLADAAESILKQFYFKTNQYIPPVN